MLTNSSAGQLQCWPTPVLTNTSAGQLQCWPTPVLAYTSAGRHQCWPTPVLFNSSAGLHQCWPTPVLANTSVGQLQCWPTPVLANTSAGQLQCWPTPCSTTVHYTDVDLSFVYGQKFVITVFVTSVLLCIYVRMYILTCSTCCSDENSIEVRCSGFHLCLRLCCVENQCQHSDSAWYGQEWGICQIRGDCVGHWRCRVQAGGMRCSCCLPGGHFGSNLQSCSAGAGGPFQVCQSKRSHYFGSTYPWRPIRY